jgi:outer membrane receptor protein involved in Fe transport
MTSQNPHKIRGLTNFPVIAMGLATGLWINPLPGEEIAEILVTGKRLAPSVNEPAYASTTLDRAALDIAAGARLDDVLRTVPGFGLFRRQSSRASHPTTQGVSLRGLGPSGAGRTLLLLDGIPQNDAFGGWIDWSRLPTAGIGGATITRGGGAGPWGNAALAGVIRLQSRDEPNDSFRGDLSVGPHDTYDGTVSGQTTPGRAVWHALVHGRRTDGSFLVRADQRGSVDVRAAERGGVGEFGGRVALSDDLVLRAVARYSESRLINGIAIAESQTRVADGAVSLLRDGDATSWELNAYARDQAFRAVFAAVNGTRTLATPSLDQFAVPSSAWGVNGIMRRQLSAQWSVDAGADVRVANGETRENFQNLGAGFTRVRVAGGQQTLAGAFAELNWQPTPGILATVGGRLDAWEQADGVRSEAAISSGAVLRNDTYADRDGTVSTARAAVRWDIETGVALRTAAYTGFRLPTLNELYRPFRVGNDITEANPALTEERLTGMDVGFDVALSDRTQLTATVFHSVLKNAVTNVTVRTAPGLDPGLGVVVPVGGVLRQRQNLSRITADGVEADLTTELAPGWQAAIRYLYAAPKVTRSPQQPALQGLRVAQVARHQGLAQLSWTSQDSLRLSAAVRGVSAQFDDDLNARALRGFVVVDALGEMPLSKIVRLNVAVENLFDRTVESARSADGLVSVGTPRTVRMGLRFGF